MASAVTALIALALPSFDGRPRPISMLVLLVVAVVLVRMTGSVVIASTTLLASVLSLGATVGVLTAASHYGWTAPMSSDALDVVLAVGFALSMVFEIFLIGRIKEYVDAGLPTDFAVRRGCARAGTVIAGVSAVLILGFALVAVVWNGPVGQVGVGLCIAVLLDVVLVRGLLMPATMTLLGEWN